VVIFGRVEVDFIVGTVKKDISVLRGGSVVGKDSPRHLMSVVNALTIVMIFRRISGIRNELLLLTEYRFYISVQDENISYSC
jgi:hypothetical protein